MMTTFFKYLRKGEAFATMLFMVLFTVMGFLQVFFRLVLQSPLSWSEEACRYLFIWSTMFGAVLVSADNEHFKVDILLNALPAPLQAVFRWLAYVIIAVFSYILIWHGYRLMMASTIRVSPALGIRMTYIYSIFVINGVLAFLHLFETIVNEFRGRKGGDK